jgi:hypothetical protein
MSRPGAGHVRARGLRARGRTCPVQTDLAVFEKTQKPLENQIIDGFGIFADNSIHIGYR